MREQKERQRGREQEEMGGKKNPKRSKEKLGAALRKHVGKAEGFNATAPARGTYRSCISFKVSLLRASNFNCPSSWHNK